MSEPLSSLQQKAMILLKTHVETHGISPSYAQIGAALGIKSKHGVSNLLDILVRKRFIKRLAKRARSIQLLQSEYHHAADCICEDCSHACYLAHLKLIHALEVDPPISAARLVGLRKLTIAMRNDWLSRRKPSPQSRAGAI